MNSKDYLLRILSFFILLIFTIPYTGYSQSRCNSDQYLEERLENDPEYRLWLKDLQTQLRKKVDYTKSVSCANPLVIPIAVHYGGGVTAANENCLIDKALEQIDVLNEDFGGYNSDISNYCDLSEICCDQYPADAISQGTCLQFCLASLDHPAGETVIGGYAITVGDHTWPSAPEWEGYLNFFVVDGIGFLGQAPLDGGADPDGNGVQILAAAFGGVGAGCTSGVGIDNDPTYNLGRTGTHEVGHYMGLEHIFNGCSSTPGPDFNTNNGDGLDDTPEQDNDNFGCPTTDTGDCSSTSEDCGTADFYFNFMDYVDDNCMYMFTEDQAQNMSTVASLAGVGTNVAYRSETITCDDADIPTYNPTYPSGCGSTTLPDSDFSPVAGTINICPGFEDIIFMDASTGCSVTGWNWIFTGAGVSPNVSTLQNPTVSVSASGTLTVTLEATNSGGVDPTPEIKNYTINILTADDPDCNDCDEDFTDSGGAGGNYQSNENMVWTFCAGVNQVVEVPFTVWDIEENAGCTFDNMEVFDGGSTSDPSLGVFCGDVLSEAPGGGTISSTDQCITFRFISDDLVNGAGWEATINCISAPTCTDGIQNGNETGIDCGGNDCVICELTCDDIFYDSGGFSENYNNNEVTETLVCADGCLDLTATFSTVDIETATSGGSDNTGCWDYLTIYDGDNTSADVLGNYCGEDSGGGDKSNVPANDLDEGDVISTSPSNLSGCLLFVFKSDTNTTEAGFEATFSCCPIVPVTFVGFDVLAGANDIFLHWATASEIQNKGFYIERSLDAIDFQSIGFIEGYTSSFARKEYRFTDSNVMTSQRYYYRLKQIDLNGRFIYTEVKTAIITDRSDTATFVIPNPNNGVFKLQFQDADLMSDIITIRVIDKTGRVVEVVDHQFTSENYISLDFTTLSTGVYSILINYTDRVIVKKLVVIN